MQLIFEILINNDLIRRPLLARGTKAAGLGLIRFLTIRGHAIQLSGYVVIVFEGPNTPWIRPASSPTKDPLHH